MPFNYNNSSTHIMGLQRVFKKKSILVKKFYFLKIKMALYFLENNPNS